MLHQNYMENFHTNSENERKEAEKRVSQNVIRQSQDLKSSVIWRELDYSSKLHYRRYVIFTNFY